MEIGNEGHLKGLDLENCSDTMNPERRIDFELVLIRHGNTTWNQERRYLGHTDLPLLAEERHKLAALQPLPELAGDFRRVYCSDLLRCRETLSAMAPHLEQQAAFDPRLRELNFGAWEGCTYDQLRHNNNYRRWIDDPGSVTPPEGESWAGFEARLDQFWGQLEQELEQVQVQMQELELGLERELGQVQVQEAELAAINASRTSTGLEDSTHIVSSSQPASHHASPQQQDSAPNLLSRGGLSKQPSPLRVLIVTHGGIIRLLLARLNEGVTFYTAAAPAPGEVIVLTLRRDEGAWRAVSFET
ncbi:histidine phosphatase family protein [Paenibacillus sp. MMS20-IR301]|uniref:histidine phosphatase family protein n=1 Tax=Paenibacillus sp. MMS20-IR301 TaxID=2895946 RepID=UPI0028EF0031|nr:histidine phosphatase family protein [Paenibacillus sp. MMS20-IR301]WNS40989.1 histidine phosphatase family protein [Paenibacillus sp. MMS20-IR301]